MGFANVRDYPENGEYTRGNNVYLLGRNPEWTDEEFLEKSKRFGQRIKSEGLDDEIKKAKRGFVDKLMKLHEGKEAFINTFGEDYYRETIKMLEYFTK